MKKVLFTATVDSHIWHFHIPYLKWFKEQGYEVHVATNGTEKIPYCDIKHTISFERNPIKINNLKAIKELKKIIDKEKFEIIHCHTPMGSVVTRLAARKSRKNGTRVLYTAHGFHFYKGAPLINWLIYYPIEKWLSRYTDCLITINNEDYEIAKKKFKKCKQVELVNGVGIDTSKFSLNMSEQEKHELRKSLNLKDDDFVLIEVGELNKNKNQIMAVNAMKDLVKENNNIHLLIVGTGKLENYYKQKIEEYNLQNNIHMLGYRKDIPQLLKISNILLSLSYREGLPVNVIEGMIYGLPIIATDCRGNRDLINDCIEINDINKLKSKIIEKCNQKKCEYDFSKYLYNNVEKTIGEIYKSVVKKSIIMLRSTDIISDSRIQKEAKTFKEHGNKVKIIGWDREKKVKKTNITKENDIEFFGVKSTYGSGMKNILKLACFEVFIFNKLTKYRKVYDIIYSCDLDTGISARIASNIFNKKMIYDVYDYYVDCHNLPKFIKSFAEKQEIKNIDYADVTIICTEQRKEQIKKAKPKKLLVIYNSPELPYNIGNMTQIIQKQSDRIKIVYVGILQDDRLLCEIGEAIMNNSKYELHIGGFGKYAEYFRKLAKEHANIFFYGTLEYQNVLKLESECDILFATYNPQIKNHKYSAPNKLYEAMALGKPIIVCKNTGIDTIVNENKLGYSIEYNAKEFIKVLDDVQKDNYKNSVDLYNKKYSWQVMKEKLLSVI